jgi:hypothetical protein
VAGPGKASYATLVLDLESDFSLNLTAMPNPLCGYFSQSFTFSRVCKGTF